jgi:hypothetical protein
LHGDTINEMDFSSCLFNSVNKLDNEWQSASIVVKLLQTIYVLQ